MENNTVDKKVIEKCTITLDKTVEDVIRLDADGTILIFDSTPGKFLELSPEDIKKLSARSKSSYFEAFHWNKMERAQEGMEPTEGVNVDPSWAEAGVRLDVKYPPGFREKFSACWKRPDELQTCLGMGYTFVTGADGAKSFMYNKKRDRHVVGAHDHEELYLMKLPKADSDAMIKSVEQKSRRQNGAVEETAMAEMEKLGGKPTNLAKGFKQV